MKKDIFSELIVPYAYVRELDVKSERKEIVYQKRSPLSQREILEKIVNTSYNKRWPNGRIHGVSKDGTYVSHSVTPYAKSFLDNIEDGIKPLVIALKDKGYLSISSCEGHCLWDRRFIKLIFPTKEAALDFQKALPFNLTYNLKHATEFLNVQLDVDQYGNINNAVKQTTDNDRQQAVDYVNVFAKRNYADAWFMEVIIADPIPVGQYFKYWKQIIFKKFFLKSYTKKITDFITSHMPANIY